MGRNMGSVQDDGRVRPALIRDTPPRGSETRQARDVKGWLLARRVPTAELAAAVSSTSDESKHQASVISTSSIASGTVGKSGERRA